MADSRLLRRPEFWRPGKVSDKSYQLRLGVVAQFVNMSAFHFSKVFKRALGLNFTEYLSRTRVETAKQLMLNPHERISEAAYAAGFQSLSQFNRVFRRVIGESPTAYRERLGGSGWTPNSGRTFAHAA